jgi:hypothetical protein
VGTASTVQRKPGYVPGGVRIAAEPPHTIPKKDLDIGVRPVGNQQALLRQLHQRGAEVSGSLDVLTAGEREFLKFTLDAFPDMSEVFVINELGYNAICLVFSVYDGDEQAKKTGICQHFLWDKGLDIEYFVLHTNNIRYDTIEPLLHITFGEGLR